MNFMTHARTHIPQSACRVSSVAVAVAVRNRPAADGPATVAARPSASDHRRRIGVREAGVGVAVAHFLLRLVAADSGEWGMLGKCFFVMELVYRRIARSSVHIHCTRVPRTRIYVFREAYPGLNDLRFIYSKAH